MNQDFVQWHYRLNELPLVLESLGTWIAATLFPPKEFLRAMFSRIPFPQGVSPCCFGYVASFFLFCRLILSCGAADLIVIDKPLRFNPSLGVTPQKNVSGKTEYRFDLARGGWAMEFNPILQSKGMIKGENWDFYAVLRLEKKQNSGLVFQMGMYSYTRKKDLFKKQIKAEILSAEESSTVFIGSAKDAEGWIWAGGPAEKNSGNAVILERIVARKMGTSMPGEFAGKRIIDIQKILYDSKRCSEISDLNSSNGRAYRFSGNAPSWSFHYNPVPEEMNTGNPWTAYAYIRAEGEADCGDIFEIGIYDQKTRKHILRKTIPMEYVKGTHYQQTELGRFEWKKGMYLWGGARKKETVKYIYLDRIILVSEQKGNER